MNKCVRITCSLEMLDDALLAIQKYARTLFIEGTIQATSPDRLKIVACGSKEKVDEFVDLVHKELARFNAQNLEIEPFLKDKDYRGVFRILQ